MSAEEALLEAARGGDATAFERLVAPQRQSLRAHCYRLLGNVADADDALQETLVGAWQGLAGFERRSTLRSWLFTIATNASMKLAARRPRRTTPPEHAPPSDPRAPLPEMNDEVPWLEPFPGSSLSEERSAEAQYSERESIELAFVAALQLLPATQRAVLILRDVLGFSAQETAAALETSVASANSALQRARDTLAQHTPAMTQAAGRHALGDEAHRALVDRFLTTWIQADVPGLVALLAEDVTFTMPPLPCWFRGRDHVSTFFAERVFALRWKFVLTVANAQPAIAAYGWDEQTARYRFEVLSVLDFVGDRVAAVSSFLNTPAERWGLPVSP